jgi:capsular polysaccharide export protein
LLDHTGVHFDARGPSDLETLLATHPLDDSADLQRAKDAIARLKEADLSKYNGHDPACPAPAPGYVLVIDQTRGDASLKACRAGRARFLEMLAIAQEEHPGAPIVIKTHPETQNGHRSGHYTEAEAQGRISLLTAPVSPWALLEGAVAVYTVSSGMGFEAILAGHRPRVFGTPFYAGWGLTEDEEPYFKRRGRKLTKAQLFLGAMIHYPVWYDPYRDELCSLERAMEALIAQTRSFREDGSGWVAEGMRLWKRGPLQRFFGQHRPMRFAEGPDADALAARHSRRQMVWASKAREGSAAVKVEDGFLRSRGLGAALVPPMSLVCDLTGMYYDPTGPSDLETLIQRSADLTPTQLLRASRLRGFLLSERLSKYNLGGTLPDLPPGRRILVPGQVEDDASMRLGAPGLTNLDLLRRAREDNPDAVILYKPHPDVEAGLRPGAVPEAAEIADAVLPKADIAALLDQVNAVWTMTSLTGFEALLRGLDVTVLGTPFYAGWGLTHDLGPALSRRTAHPSLDALVHATLIAYPRYVDPVTKAACPVEVIAERLAYDEVPKPGAAYRALSKAQGALSSFSGLWR